MRKSDTAARIQLRPPPALQRAARESPVSRVDLTRTVERALDGGACRRTDGSHRTAAPTARDPGKRRVVRQASSSERPLRAPALRPDRPALVSAPTARDLEIPRRIALELESQAADERY